MLYSNCMKPVALPPGRARLVDEAGADRIGDITNTIGTVRVACSNAATVVPPRPG